MKALKVIGQLCKWTARVLAGLLLLAALAMALIQTPWAKRRLASLTARVLSTENVRVSIGRLQGLVPFDVRVDEIRLADASGDWLQAAGVQIQLSAADLARRRLVFQYVRVARLHLSRWPETAERPAAPPAAVRPAAHGPHIEFRRVQVNTLLLDKAVAGESLTLLVHGSADVSPAAGGRVQCQVLRLDDRIGSARVTASWNGSPATLTLDAELHDDPRGPLARRLPSPATGPLRAQLTGEGPMKAFRGRLEAGAEGFGQFSTTFTLDARRPLALDFKALFQNDGGLPLPFKEVALSGHADRLLDQPAGEFDAKVIYDDEPFAARMAVLYQDGRLQVSNLDFQAGSVSVKGNLTFDPESRLARGRLTAALPYLSEIANRWGWPVGGDARLDIELETAGDEQGVTIRGEGGNLTTPFAGAADFRLNARIQQAWHRPRGRVELVLHDVTAKQVAFSNLTFSVEGDKEALAWSVDAAGRALQPFDVSASGQFREADGERSMRIDKMTGRFAGRTCRLAAPAAVTVGRDRLAWGPITWQIGTGRLTTSGAFTGQDVQATMELNQLPLGVVSELGWPELEGHASGKLEIQGPCSRPAAELQLKFSGVKPRQPLVIPLTTAEADVRLRAQEGRLSAEWTLLGPARVSAAG
ncbi:MAG: hypothetical protein KJ726_09685, partial [Verrucomicrobia bacterium]|nr:hypothetical protein [Verrucomicrobiota bacterium]